MSQDNSALTGAFPVPKEGMSSLDAVLHAMSIAVYEVYSARSCIMNDKVDGLECSSDEPDEQNVIKIPLSYIDDLTEKANAKASIRQIYTNQSHALNGGGKEPVPEIETPCVVQLSASYADDLFRQAMARTPDIIRSFDIPLIRKIAQAEYTKMSVDDRRFYFDQILSKVAEKECVPMAHEIG